MADTGDLKLQVRPWTLPNAAGEQWVESEVVSLIHYQVASNVSDLHGVSWDLLLFSCLMLLFCFDSGNGQQVLECLLVFGYTASRCKGWQGAPFPGMRPRWNVDRSDRLDNPSPES